MSRLSRIQHLREERKEHNRIHKLLSSDEFDLV